MQPLGAAAKRINNNNNNNGEFLLSPISLTISKTLHAAGLLWFLSRSRVFLLSSYSSTAISPRLSSANGESIPSFIFLCNGKCKSEISVCEHFYEKTNIFIGTGQPANQLRNCWLLFLPWRNASACKATGKNFRGWRIKGPFSAFRRVICNALLQHNFPSLLLTKEALLLSVSLIISIPYTLHS